MAGSWGNPNWVKGVCQNPGGKVSKYKQFDEALKRAILQDKGQRLRLAAEQLLDKAAAGEPWALEMLAERLDGKALSAIDLRALDADGQPISIAVIAYNDSVQLRTPALPAPDPEGPGLGH